VSNISRLLQMAKLCQQVCGTRMTGVIWHFRDDHGDILSIQHLKMHLHCSLFYTNNFASQESLKRDLSWQKNT
jgi:hypothetical protein